MHWKSWQLKKQDIKSVRLKGYIKKQRRRKFEVWLSCYLLIPPLRTDRKYLVSFYPPKPEHFNFRHIFKGPSRAACSIHVSLKSFVSSRMNISILFVHKCPVRKACTYARHFSFFFKILKIFQNAEGNHETAASIFLASLTTVELKYFCVILIFWNGAKNEISMISLKKMVILNCRFSLKVTCGFLATKATEEIVRI